MSNGSHAVLWQPCTVGCPRVDREGERWKELDGESLSRQRDSLLVEDLEPMIRKMIYRTVGAANSFNSSSLKVVENFQGFMAANSPGG